VVRILRDDKRRFIDKDLLPILADCIQEIGNAANRNGYDALEMVSGAGHDAFYLARVAPTGMIFIPCEEGISHNPIESASKDDCAAGCQVLLEVAMKRAGVKATMT
jgi:N-carbamoyl-L-amino-acid hydrolase